MLNVTYYLGAGASAQKLPTAKKTPSSISMSSSFLEMIDLLKSDTSINPEYFVTRDYLINKLAWLAEGSNKFGTVDTFAKYLFLKEKGKLSDLKKTLSYFFIILQTVTKKIDDRPLIFLTTVMRDGYTFPKHIKIISWNYDFQIQLAGAEFRTEAFSFGFQLSQQSDPLIKYFPSLGDISFTHTDEVSMVHLNGIAGFFQYNDPNHTLILSHFHNKLPKDINDFFKKIATVNDDRNLLTFAWEHINFSNESLKIAKEIIKNTDILVVVGYSFPFFNREIDDDIFSAIKESGRLKKIFFQDPYKSGEFLKNQFELDERIKIFDIPSEGNYHVPMDL